jgi:hypothetical protein
VKNVFPITILHVSVFFPVAVEMSFEKCREFRSSNNPVNFSPNPLLSMLGSPFPSRTSRNDNDDGKPPEWRAISNNDIPKTNLHHIARNRNFRSLALFPLLKKVGGVPSIACLTNPKRECKVCPSAMTQEGIKNFRYLLHEEHV